jgi:DNA-binding NarL/FixJ family response regulator
MAEVRKSSTLTTARTRAREKAAEFRQKHDTLEKLAAEYFVATDSVQKVHASVDKEIAAARKRGEKLSAQARTQTQSVIHAMLKLGVTRSEVARRLGIPTRDVSKTATQVVTPDTTGNGDTGNDPAPK